MSSSNAHRAGGAALAVGALGVVFGDIGTSPLYAIQTVFSEDAARQVAVQREEIFGIASLIFWSITTIVTLQYVVFITRADNGGEGGIMALIGLTRQLIDKAGPKAVGVLAALGIFGASLFFGDSMITPAISVLSAVEGLQVVAPSVEHLVVPITAAILIGLFMIQKLGTQFVGRYFGPIMLVWFTSIGAIGVNGIVDNPEVFKALSPTYALEFLLDDKLTAFLALGGVVLAVTGAEALYADMGHFGRGPISRAWLFVAFPALILNYLGQGALLLEHPEGASNPFFLLVPHSIRVPMVILACVATVIAAQSVISGAFSLTRQAVQLGYLPRLRIVHTSHEEGQVYVPFINWALLSAVLVLVFAFRHSEKLASAYGVAVMGTICITTFSFLFYMRTTGRWKPWQVYLAGAIFLTVDVAFLASNLAKVLTGGWLPLVVGAAVFTAMFTWQMGQRIVTANRSRAEGPLQDFVDRLHEMDPPVQRVRGTAVFLNRGLETAPLAMRANVEFNHTLHEDVVILSIETRPVPHVPESERLTITDLVHRDDAISHVTAHFGFMDEPDVPLLLRQAAVSGLEDPISLEEVTYFLSAIDIVATDEPSMPMWRKRLFLATAHIAGDAIDYFRLPRDRTVILGSHIDI